jgi:TPR repeat protein
MAALLFATSIGFAQNFEKKAKSGNVQAQFELAKQYYSGIGQLQNYKQSLVWYEKAAKGGNVESMYCTAKMYEEGVGCTQNLRTAFDYYLTAAERGHIASQSKVATMFEAGEGTMKSESRAYLWYRVCADRDEALACRKIGDFYAEGRVVGKDHTEAKLWYEKAIAAGEKGSLIVSSKNNVITYDEQKITEIITAMTNLANLYTADEGLAPNADKAKELTDAAKTLSSKLEKGK